MVNMCATVLILNISYHNYPGGVAMSKLHEIEARENGNLCTVTVLCRFNYWKIKTLEMAYRNNFNKLCYYYFFAVLLIFNLRACLLYYIFLLIPNHCITLLTHFKISLFCFWSYHFNLIYRSALYDNYIVKISAVKIVKLLGHMFAKRRSKTFCKIWNTIEIL